MIATVFRRTTCRLCESDNLELVWHLTPTPGGDAYISSEHLGKKQEVYPLDIVLCRSCGHSQLYDVVDPKLLYGNYIYTTSISLGLAGHFQKYADEVIYRVNPPKGAFVIDIGSNDGTLLKFFKSREMSVLGIDPAPQAVKKAREFGIETLQTFFTADLARKIKKEHGPAIIITANNVFANIDNLCEIMEGLRELMAPDGVFVFETGYLLDLIKGKLIDNIYHEHLSYYAVKPLEAFLRRHGMELIDVKRISSKGGSFRAIVQFEGGQRAVSPSVVELIELEAKMGIDSPDVFKNISNEIEVIKKQLLDLLRDLKAQGKKIAGYGASVGVTTMIYLFNLAKSLNFLLDDNPAKQGTLSPGYHIPVLPSEILYERKPDYVLILGWRYAEPIMKKHQAYLKQGGHFIVPLPEIKVI